MRDRVRHAAIHVHRQRGGAVGRLHQVVLGALRVSGDGHENGQRKQGGEESHADQAGKSDVVAHAKLPVVVADLKGATWRRTCDDHWPVIEDPDTLRAE